tara:strand:- start:7901 stop:9385 length:1485 start_codon:yes stop_codon:yes gene_type:complete
MKKDVQKLIQAGQLEDSVIVHAAPGEMVVPPVISEQTQQMINQDMQSVGLDPASYMVGQGSINKTTGLQEFGFLSDLFKKVKKVVKKVAPIAVSFIPGIGPIAKGALTAVAGKASGMDTKDALLGGLTAGLGAKFAGGTGTAGKGLSKLKGTSGKFFGKEGTFRNILKAGKEYVLPGEDKKGLFKNIFGGGLGSGQQEVMMPEGDFSMVSGGQQDYEINPVVTELYKTGQITYQEGFDGMPGYFTNKAGDKFYTPEEVEAAYSPQQTGNRLQQLQQGGLGSFLSRKLLPQKLEDALQGSGGFGNLISRKLLPQAMEDRIQEGGIGNMFGQNTGLMGLAALYGLATKKAAEKTEGGLRDVRLSTRPDLMPQQVFQGFDVGVRPGMSYGGGMGYRPGFAMGTPDGLMKEMIGELDLRPGGPSVGPGTETSDDIPAMLSDGEFVHTAKANKGLGGFKIEKNKNSITLYPAGKPDREQGFKNNDMMMKMFEDYQEMVS